MSETLIPYDETLPERPPANVESERSIIGSLMLNPDLWAEIASTVTASDFTDPAARIVFESLARLAKLGRPFDLALIEDDLTRRGEWENVGGISGVASYEQYVISSASAPDHARRVAEKARLRRLLGALDGIRSEVLTEADAKTGEPLSGEQILDRAASSIFAIAAQSGTGRGLLPASEIATENLDKHEALWRGGRRPGTETHFRDVDLFTSGLRAGELIILAARPSMGKTALALNIAVQIAKGGPLRSAQRTEPRGVAIFSLEQGRSELIDRAVAAMTRIDSTKIRDGALSIEEKRRIGEAHYSLGAMPLWIDDSATMTPGRAVAQLRRLKAREPHLVLCIFDYLQLMRGDGRSENRRLEIEGITRALKGAARDLGIAVLCLSQLSRASETESRVPKLSDLRESGSIEQDADVVLFIHRERSEGRISPESDLIVAKQRNGPTGKIQLHFDGRTLTFLDALPNPRPSAPPRRDGGWTNETD